jgi:hypothetical protein
MKRRKAYFEGIDAIERAGAYSAPSCLSTESYGDLGSVSMYSFKDYNRRTT